MPQNKNQHYVPKAHLAPFSPDGEGKAINVLNLKARKLIPNAPIKGQCAKHYFYSDPEDMRGEKVLERLEGEYAEVVRNLSASPASASDLDLAKLRFFVHVQLHRTEASVSRMRHSHDVMRAATREGAPAGWDLDKEAPPLTDRQLLMESMRLGIETQKAVADLKPCIVVNEAFPAFVTSDDPAIFTNRYSFEASGGSGGNFGYANTGAILLMPLTPRLLFLAYDKDAYRVARANRGITMSLARRDDIEALNDLQFIKAAHNIYFSSWTDGPAYLGASTAVASRRLEHWSNVSVLVRQGAEPGEEVYTAATPAERSTARQKLIVLHSRYPRPGRWLSTLKVNSQPKCVVTGTGAGTLREHQFELMMKERSNRPARRPRMRLKGKFP